MHQVRQFAKKLFLAIGGPYAKEALGALEREDWLTTLTGWDAPNPRGFRTASEYRDAAIVRSLFRKTQLPGSRDKRRRAAIDTFLQCELANKFHNDRMRRLGRMVRGEILIPESERLYVEVVVAWRAALRRALGRVPDTVEPAYSGGSTLSDRGPQTTIPDKMSSQQTWYPTSITHLLHDHLFHHTPVSPLWVGVRGSTFFTVPKDSRKDRGCCMEASGSLAFQLGVGRVLKERYRKRYGVDLKRVPDLHREAAKAASIRRDRATIDLSSASDTVCKELVKLVLPDDWFALLNSLRAPFTYVDGRWMRLEMFSSMGNGFTFELETFLFRTLGEVITQGYLSVFGDDIIIDQEAAPVMVHLLRYFGFKPNASKTFLDGSFRESCGGDYFDGIPVRGHFLKKLPDEPQKWVALANGITRLGLFKSAAWWVCWNAVPTVWRNLGPESLGDLCFTDPSPEPTLMYHKPTQRHEPYYRVMVPIPVTFRLEEHFRYDIVVAASCKGVSADVPVRGKVRGFRRAKVLAYGQPGLPEVFLG